MDWKNEVPGLAAASFTALVHAFIHLLSLKESSFSTLMGSGWMAATGVVFVATYLGYKAVADSEVMDNWFDDELVQSSINVIAVAVVVGAAHYSTHVLVGNQEVFEAAMTAEAGIAAAVTAGVSTWIGRAVSE